MVKERLFPKKSLGQHFLRDDEILDDILHNAGLKEEDTVLEVGAGDGTLTVPLSEEAGKVIAIETDRRCLPILHRLFPDGGRVEVVEADFLTYDLNHLSAYAPLKCVSDLPYNIATRILERLLEKRSLFSLLVLMFQREVAERLTAEPGSKAFGSLSLATQYRARAEMVRIIPASAFSPPPKVESALIRIVPREESLLPPAGEKIFFRLIRAAFSHRRKTLVNSLAMGGFSPEAGVAEALDSLGIPSRARAENLCLDDYLALSGSLSD